MNLLMWNEREIDETRKKGEKGNRNTQIRVKERKENRRKELENWEQRLRERNRNRERNG